jgi:hypothetical protein
MSNIHIINNNDRSNRIQVTLTLTDSGKSHLLKLVKAVKDMTKIGLKESKEMIDQLRAGHPQIIKAWITGEEFRSLKSSLEECIDSKWTLTDLEYTRNRKLIELGLGTYEDLVDELVNQDYCQLIVDKDPDGMKSILKDRYSRIPENELKQILNIR